MVSVLTEGYESLPRTQAELTSGGLGHKVGSRVVEEGGETMDTENDPALEMGQRMWQKAKEAKGAKSRGSAECGISKQT